MMLTFDWMNEEECFISLDSTLIITMAHGPHGWDGMEGIQKALLNVARAAGWEVQVFGDPAI